MKKSISMTLAFALLLLPLAGTGRTQPFTGECLELYRQLEQYSSREKVDDITLGACSTMVEKLERQGCILGLGYITELYGTVCLKADSDLGVHKYIEYLIAQENSAEEALSFMFERIFIKKPETVFGTISQYGQDRRNMLLKEIGWGFLNNNVNANENNYKKLFFSKNPKLPGLYKTYKDYIDYIFEKIENYYSWLRQRSSKQ
jgi:hypothetical protein